MSGLTFAGVVRVNGMVIMREDRYQMLEEIAKAFFFMQTTLTMTANDIAQLRARYEALPADASASSMQGGAPCVADTPRADTSREAHDGKSKL